MLQDYFSLPPTVNFCEEPTSGMIARLGYFVSNFPYIALGLYLYFKQGLARKFAYYSIFIGLMSCLYDATYRLWAQHLDLLAMFCFISFLAGLNVKILTQKTLLAKITQFGLPLICLAIIIALGGSAGQILFFICALAVLISFYFFPNKQKIYFKYLYLGVVFLIIGFFAWLPDRFQLLCFDLTLSNGRAIFHYLTTFTIYFVYKFYQENQLAD